MQQLTKSMSWVALGSYLSRFHHSQAGPPALDGQGVLVLATDHVDEILPSLVKSKKASLTATDIIRQETTEFQQEHKQPSRKENYHPKICYDG
jgi:hypothetical protein